MGYLLRLASDDRVLKTFDFAKNLYLTAEDFIAIVFTHKDERQGTRRKCHEPIVG
jgi:hypothetical protein